MADAGQEGAVMGARIVSRKAKQSRKPAGISEKFIRLLEVYMLIANRKFPSVQYLRDRFGVTARTVYRYLELVNLVEPLEYDGVRNGYGFTGGDPRKRIVLSNDELVMLLAAGEAVSHLGTTFREGFRGLAERLFASMGKKPAQVKKTVIVKTADSETEKESERFLQCFSKCIAERRSVDLTYRAQNTKSVTERTIDPYGLVFHEGLWFLVAFCHLRKRIRTFAVDRVIDAKDRNLLFMPVEGFDLEGYLARSWGVVDDKVVHVTMRFDPGITDYILRKKRWHPSEKRTILPDGSVELSFSVCGTIEIKRWIYSWLPHVSVIKPLWLKKKVQNDMALALKNHQA
jgi:predicted DNA-binding transcriptional regulator YafY